MHVTSIFVTHDQEEALEVADRVVLMNRGRIEQAGTPGEVWEHPATPFVYGFLGDVNLFQGRAHQGAVHLGGLHLKSPEHIDAQNEKAFAYVRPHELALERYRPGAAAAGGLVVRLERAVVVGPLARLELVAAEEAKAGDNRGVAALIEAQIPAREFGEKGFREGETLVATPRRARVFVESAR